MGVTFSFPIVFVSCHAHQVIANSKVGNIHYPMPRLWVWAKDSPFNRTLISPKYS
jgi:hypothetical protein